MITSIDYEIGCEDDKKDPLVTPVEQMSKPVNLDPGRTDSKYYYASSDNDDFCSLQSPVMNSGGRDIKIELDINKYINPTVSIIHEQDGYDEEDEPEEVPLKSGNSRLRSSVLSLYSTKLFNKVPINNEINKSIENNVINNFKKMNIKFDLNCLKHLFLFDLFKLSINNENWETVQIFLFESHLIILTEKGDEIIGSILMTDFNKVVKINDYTISLYLKCQLSEISLFNENLLVVIKWMNHLNEFNLNPNLQIPYSQITTNLWKLVEKHNIPNDVLNFENNFKNFLPNFNIKKNNINFLLGVSLMNLDDKLHSNEEYLRKVRNIIKNSLNSLSSPDDKFGLIIIGRDKYRDFNINEGTFYGFVNNQWDGWSEIIDSLEVFNLEQEQEQDAFDENKVYELNLKKFFSFNSINSKEINQTCLIFQNETIKFDKFKKFSNTSINFFHLIEKKIKGSNLIIDDLNETNFQYKRVNELHEVNISKSINNYKKIYLTDLLISVKTARKFSDLVKLNKIEINGKFHKVDNNEITLKFNSVSNGFFKNFKFDYHLLERRADSCEDEAVFEIKYKYFNLISKQELNQLKKVGLKCYNLRDGSRNKGKSKKLQLLKPIIFKDSIYIKRETELFIIDKLKNHELNEANFSDIIRFINQNKFNNSTVDRNFFKLTRFKNNFRSFNDYLNELSVRLGDIFMCENELALADFINSLEMSQFFTSRHRLREG